MSASGGAPGIGFVGMLTILFIALKLHGEIHWSWFWVLSPMIFAALFIIFILGTAITVWIKSD